MKEAATKHFKVALHGMDSRSEKTMALFFLGACQGSAIMVNAEDAEIDVFDVDVTDSKSLLEKHLQAPLIKPVIVLSLQDFVHDGVLYLKKPVKADEMLAMLAQARALPKEFLQKSVAPESLPEPKEAEKDIMDLFNDELFDFISSTTSTWTDEPISQGPAEKLREVYAPVKQEPKAPEAMVLAGDQAEGHHLPESQMEVSTQPTSEISAPVEDEPEEQELKTFVRSGERDKTSKHQTAMRLDEQGFDEYMLTQEQSFFNDIDGLGGKSPYDPKRFINADYDSNEYFQGYFKHVLDSCQDTHPVMLQSSWHPIAVFPLIQEVWFDATDEELKAFAETSFKNSPFSKEATVSGINIDTMNMDGALEKFHTNEAFLWKLASWASKGRYPRGIDYNLPVYLEHWPNFTRLLITPHALRIAALLIQGPRTMLNIAETLNIHPQYVFVFISAAHSTGIAGQARRSADILVQLPDVKPSKGQGLLGRILNKLRSNTT
jgi:hypothetical protein